MRCIACKLEIEEGATKCVHCDTIQSWRRHLTFGSTVLSLLVALVSVSTVLIPIVAKTFAEDKAIIAGTMLSSGPMKLFWTSSWSGAQDAGISGLTYLYQPTFVASNSGSLPGLLVEICYELQLEYDGSNHSNSACKQFESDQALMETNEVFVFQPEQEFMLDHPALPREFVTRRGQQDFRPRVGPISLSGHVAITFQNEIGISHTENHKVQASDIVFQE